MRCLRTMLRIAGRAHEAPMPASSFGTLGSRKPVSMRGIEPLTTW